MATTKKKATVKKDRAAPKKATAKRAPVRKKTIKHNAAHQALNNALDQLGEMTDSAILKAKELAAQEEALEKKATSAAKSELDKAKHLVSQAEKWMKARIKSDTKRIKALEKKLAKQLRDKERKLLAQARAAEKKAQRETKKLRKELESRAKKTLGINSPARRKPAAAKRKVAASRAKSPAR